MPAEAVVPSATTPSQTNGTRLLLFVVASLLVANVGQWLLAKAFHLDRPDSIKLMVGDFWHVRQWTDSWLPMMKSLDYFRDFPQKPIYYAPLYDTLIYSLVSLLPLQLLRKLGMGDAAMLRFLAITSFLAVIGIAVAALAMGRRLLARRNARLDWQTVLAVVLATLFCYPVLKGFALGNAQTYLSFGFAVMLWQWTTDRERGAGITACLITCVKPQYVLILFWMLLRRRWNAAIAFLATGAVLFAIAIAVFGLHNNLDFLAVLSSLSHKAQSHFGNQSMFGTLNRMIGNGENISYTPHLYTPYVAWIYRTTVLTAVALLALALFFPWGALRSSTGDLAAIGFVSVMSSPMAWEHHYGIVLGIFAWLWFAYGAGQEKRPWLTGVAFFLTTNFLPLFNLLADHRGWNILQSYLYFGAWLLLTVLMLLARRVTGGRVPALP